jgi:23S rRNA (cytidine2498-2'-O)-methyltransferase
MLTLPSDHALYLAKKDFLQEIKTELKDFLLLGENLFCAHADVDPCFVQDIWYEPKILPIQSISTAAKALRQLTKYWYLHPIACIRRSRLIEAQLPKLPDLNRGFPIKETIPPIGVFGLLDSNTLIYSLRRLKMWPDGVCQFIEDKKNPPNRAYLKLWEALSYLNRYPTSGETALDLGASPGGWSYVLQKLGAKVTSIDKAPLDPRVATLPGITFIQQSAFAYDPSDLEQAYDWVFSDVACYPERAYDLIVKWLDSNQAKQLIFTIKLQGKTDLKSLDRFRDIPRSKIVNLFYNKHEATFFHPFDGSV